LLCYLKNLRPRAALGTLRPIGYLHPMALSARNQLRGHIKELKLGTVMAHIVIQVGENEIESVITRRSVEEMGLKVGDAVTAVVKSTEVMIQK
jgi:molybdopterin-binding protein